jgi:hypothetical protein
MHTAENLKAIEPWLLYNRFHDKMTSKKRVDTHVYQQQQLLND